MKKKINYDELNEIVVKSQKELDDIPLDYKGRIYIEFGDIWNRAIIKNKYYSSVVAWGNSSVVAWENSSVEARENSSVEARGNSSVVAWENSSVVAWENSSVEARGNSSVEARENSSVEAQGNVQVVDRLQKGKILISGNARKIYMPKNIFEFMDFYGIKHTKKKAIFYKVVRKENNKYYSNYNNDFTYEIGKIKKEICDPDIQDNCSYGIHIAHLQWALNYGKDWNNLAILEVETKIENIVMPADTDGKVRTSEIKVIREVPLNECGLYGQIIEKRRNKNVNSQDRRYS